MITDRTDLQVPGFLVVHPASVPCQAQDVDLPGEGREYADDQTDLHAKVSGKINASSDGFTAEFNSEFTVGNWWIAAMVILVIALIFSLATGMVVLVAAPKTGTPVVIALGLIGGTAMAALAGAALHRARRWWYLHRHER